MADKAQFRWWMVPVLIVAVLIGLLAFGLVGALMGKDPQATCPDDEFKPA